MWLPQLHCYRVPLNVPGPVPLREAVIKSLLRSDDRSRKRFRSFSLERSGSYQSPSPTSAHRRRVRLPLYTSLTITAHHYTALMAQRSVYTAWTTPDSALAAFYMAISAFCTALSTSCTALTVADTAPQCDNTAHTAPAMLSMTAMAPLAVHVLVMST